MHEFLLVLASLMALAGVAGNLLPVLPGTPLNYIALLMLHLVRGGEVFSNTFLLTMGLLTVASLAFDYVMPLIGAKAFGATKQGMAGSVIGMIVGFMVFNIPGMVIGMFIGAVAGELYAGKSGRDALRSGAASVAGSAAATALKLGLSLVMAGYFFVYLFGLAGA